MFCQAGVVYNLFTGEEWKQIQIFCASVQINVPDLDFSAATGLTIAEYAQLFKYILVKIDSIPEARNTHDYLQVIYLLSTKLAIFRPFNY